MLCDEMREKYIAGPSVFKKKGEPIEDIFIFKT